MKALVYFVVALFTFTCTSCTKEVPAVPNQNKQNELPPPPTLEDYLGTYQFSASTLSFVDGNEVHGEHVWVDVLKKAPGTVNLIQFWNMADMQNDSYPLNVCYADFKWDEPNLSLLANRYAYPELNGYIHGGFIGCIFYDSGPKKNKITMMVEFNVSFNKTTNSLVFPSTFTDPDDGSVWPASYVVFGWDNTGKPAGILSPYMSNLTAVKINHT